MFNDGELESSFEIYILPEARLEEDITFSIELLPPSTKGAKLGRIQITNVTLTRDEEFKRMVDRFA